MINKPIRSMRAIDAVFRVSAAARRRRQLPAVLGNADGRRQKRRFTEEVPRVSRRRFSLRFVIDVADEGLDVDAGIFGESVHDEVEQRTEGNEVHVAAEDDGIMRIGR